MIEHTPALPASQPSPLFRRAWLKWALATIIVLAFVCLAALLFPRIFTLFWYPGIKTLLYEDLGFSEAWSSFFAVIGSFFDAVLWIPLTWWTFRASSSRFNLRFVAPALAGWVVVYGYAPLLHAILGQENCVNQRTGEQIKWFAIQPGGQIVLFDSPGFDATGVKRRPATLEVCRILQLQKHSIRPRHIADNVLSIKFFDDTTGQPRVWYYEAADGHLELFDAEGMHPTFGEPLAPVTAKVVQQLLANATAAQAEAERLAELKEVQQKERAAESERAARLTAETARAEAKEKAHKDLVDLFGVSSYAEGTILIGATARQKDDLSSLAARQILITFIAGLRKKGVIVDEFKPQVYSGGYFEMLIAGNSGIMNEVGLLQRTRGAVLVAVDAKCRPPSEISGLVACTTSIQIRILAPTGNSRLEQATEIGAGADTSQALYRAAELLAQRHLDLLDPM